MRRLWKKGIGAFVIALSLIWFPLPAKALVVIDFGTGDAGTGGGIMTDLINAVGSGIPIAAMTVTGTAMDETYDVSGPADGSKLPLVGTLNFDTIEDTLSIFGFIPALGMDTPVELLSGSFSSFEISLKAGGRGLEFEAEGIDTKAPELLTALGVDLLTRFEYFGFSLSSDITKISEPGSPDLYGGTVYSTDILNAQVPEPATMLLFCLGLVGIGALGRKRS